MSRLHPILLRKRELVARQPGPRERAQLDQQQQVLASDHGAIDLAAEIQQAGEFAKDGPGDLSVASCARRQASDRRQRHAHRADGPALLLPCRIVFDDIPIRAVLHARRQQHNTPLARLLDRGAKSVGSQAA